MKNVIVLIILGLFAYGIYYGYTQYYEKKMLFASKQTNVRDLAFSDFKADIIVEAAGTGLYVNAGWKCKMNNPPNSSAFMECVVTETESGYGKKIVIATSETLRNITDPGHLSCRINKNDIPKDHPYLWVKLNSVINKVKQKPIVILLGKVN